MCYQFSFHKKDYKKRPNNGKKKEKEKKLRLGNTRNIFFYKRTSSEKNQVRGIIKKILSIICTRKGLGRTNEEEHVRKPPVYGL